MLISINPATLEKNGEVQETAAEDVGIIVDEARMAFPDWAKLPVRSRSAYLLSARNHILANIDRFAETITRETGKPLAEAITSELFPIADLLYHFATRSSGYLRDQRIGIGYMSLLLRRSRLFFPPYGVVAVISPWNYPFAIPMGHIAMSLVAGNVVVCKSSELTPLVGQLIEETWRAANLPESVFSHVMGGADVGEALVSQHIDKLFFTGSAEVGRHLGKTCGARLIPCVLELGGKDAMIVLEDADLEQAASAAVWGAFTNCGQACAAVERLYVHTDIAEKITTLIVEKTRKLRVGNGLDPAMDMGPLSNKDQLDKVMAHIEDAMSRGAEILTGGRPLADMKGYFFAPTVLNHVDHAHICMREETFGPLLPIMSFTSDTQVVSLANDSPYGLTASVWSRNRCRAEALARQLHAGTIMINECVYTHAISQTPWGGDGLSGLGRSHGKLGLMECVRTHHLHTHSTKLKSLWWFPYDANVVRAFKSMTKTLTGPLWKWILSAPAFVYLAFRKKN